MLIGNVADLNMDTLGVNPFEATVNVAVFVTRGLGQDVVGDGQMIVESIRTHIALHFLDFGMMMMMILLHSENAGSK